MRRIFRCSILALALAACHDPDAYVLGPDAVDAVLSVTVSETVLPADGIARAMIVAQLDPRTDADKRTVTFSTSAGTLIGGGKEGSTTTVTADTSGRAVAELRSATAAGSARIEITVGAVSRTAAVEFVPVDLSQIVGLTVSPSSAPADGASLVDVVATIAAGLPSGRRNVTFRTNLGEFRPGDGDTLTIEADRSNVAHVSLSSSTVGTARVSATADGATAVANVTFTQSRPDSLFVSPAASTLRSGESTIVTVTLLREIGEVSPRLQVSYSATTETGVSIGTFSDVTLADEGVSRATFHLGTTMYLGPVTIRATVADEDGTAIVEVVP